MTIKPGVAKLVDQELRRLNALSDLEQIGSPPEERFDRITRLAQTVFGVPVAEINFLDDAVQFTKSPQVPGGSPFAPRSESFCDVTIQGPEVLVVPDATADSRFATRSTVTGPRHTRFYAGAPLTVGDGHRVGSLCLVDTTPREFSENERSILEQMGRLVERELRVGAPRATPAGDDRL